MGSLEKRRAAFGRFVRRALDDAESRGLTIAEIERRTGIGSTTFYRWRDGDWARDPVAGKVDAFCAGLEIPTSAAYTALGWGNADNPNPQPEPLVEPDLRLIQRRLLDPNVSDEEKADIRSALKFLTRPGRRREAAG